MSMILRNIFQNKPISKTVINFQIITSRRRIKTVSCAMDEVQIISTEAIKPSSPTPKHLRTYELSMLDQMFSNLYMPFVFFYSANKHQDFRKNSDFLKQSLAKTLTHYYPLAGRFIDSFSVECNDHGVTFIEAHVGCDMSKFLQPPNMVVMQQLIPPSPQSLRLEASERALLAVQVNYFSTGDVAIGICIWHGLADGSAISNFMKLWAEINRGVNENICNNVVLDCTSLFPPHSSLKDQHIKPQLTSKVVFKRLFFDGKKIVALKEKVNKEIMVGSFDHELQASRFMVVSSLIWGAFIAVARERKRAINNKLYSHAMYYTMNLRSKMNPPMIPQCMGNIFRFVRAEWSLAEDDDIEATSLVKKVIKAKRNESNVMNNIEYLGFMKDMNEAWEDSRSLTLTSVVGLRYYEADFGWGKPVWLSIGSVSLPNAALLSDTSDGKGVEAWVVLYEEDMDKFEKNPSIMAHASSNPSILIAK
ncbi:HXXXD-type acyl-transferase family protein [Citrus sinensis]|uniref:HXXXD-type acyl-transferase family protein n=1 Tax=Citrus sinensis TaxID=2711 RepID=A0ACB8JJY5_CITSI|nr:HXXXD-type acyl-transferase family protein [Citrus sinensis]